MRIDARTAASVRHLGEMTDSQWLRHRHNEIERGIRAAHRERGREIRRCFRGLVGLVRR